MARVARTAVSRSPSLWPHWASVQIEGQKWVVPRTADGRPDLEGVWENNGATPLERPAPARGQAAAVGRGAGGARAPREHAVRAGGEAVFGDALYSPCWPTPSPLDLARQVPTVRTGCRIGTSSTARR